MRTTSERIHITETCSCGNHSTTTKVWALEAGLLWYNCDSHSTHTIEMRDIPKKVMGLKNLGEDTSRLKMDKKYWEDLTDK